jgi:hypothetical protein
MPVVGVLLLLLAQRQQQQHHQRTDHGDGSTIM